MHGLLSQLTIFSALISSSEGDNRYLSHKFSLVRSRHELAQLAYLEAAKLVPQSRATPKWLTVGQLSRRYDDCAKGLGPLQLHELAIFHAALDRKFRDQPEVARQQKAILNECFNFAWDYVPPDSALRDALGLSANSAPEEVVIFLS